MKDYPRFGNKPGEFFCQICKHVVAVATKLRRFPNQGEGRRYSHVKIDGEGYSVTTATRITTHPGEVLREHFMLPYGLSAHVLASRLNIPADHISNIMQGELDVSVDLAFRLSCYFGTSPELWINLQSEHDLSKAIRH